MSKKYEGLAVGIDCGTTYSCVVVWLDEHNRVEIIHNYQGNRTTRSFISFKYDQRLIGDVVKNQAALNPTSTIFGKFLFSNINLFLILVFFFVLVHIEYLILFS